MNKIKKIFIYCTTIWSVLNAGFVFAMDHNNRPRREENMIDLQEQNNELTQELLNEIDSNMGMGEIELIEGYTEFSAEKSILSCFKEEEPELKEKQREKKINDEEIQFQKKRISKNNFVNKNLIKPKEKILELKEQLLELLIRFYIKTMLEEPPFSDFSQLDGEETDKIFANFFGSGVNSFKKGLLHKIYNVYYVTHVKNGVILEDSYMFPCFLNLSSKEGKPINILQYALRSFNEKLGNKVIELDADYFNFLKGDFIFYLNKQYDKFVGKETENQLLGLDILDKLTKYTKDNIAEAISLISFDEYKEALKNTKITMQDLSINEGLQDVSPIFLNGSAKQIKKELYTLLFKYNVILYIKKLLEETHYETILSYEDDEASFLSFLYNVKKECKGKELCEGILINDIFKMIYKYYTVEKNKKIENINNLKVILDSFNEKFKNSSLNKDIFAYLKQGLLKHLEETGIKKYGEKLLDKILEEISLDEYKEKIQNMKISIEDLENLVFKEDSQRYKENLASKLKIKEDESLKSNFLKGSVPHAGIMRLRATNKVENSENIRQNMFIVKNTMQDFLSKFKDKHFLDGFSRYGISADPIEFKPGEIYFQDDNLKQNISEDDSNSAGQKFLSFVVYLPLFLNEKTKEHLEKLISEGEFSYQNFFKEVKEIFEKNQESDLRLERILKKIITSLIFYRKVIEYYTRTEEYYGLNTILNENREMARTQNDRIARLKFNKELDFENLFKVIEDVKWEIDKFINIDFFNELLKSSCGRIYLEDNNERVLENYPLTYGSVTDDESIKSYLSDRKIEAKEFFVTFDDGYYCDYAKDYVMNMPGNKKMENRQAFKYISAALLIWFIFNSREYPNGCIYDVTLNEKQNGDVEVKLVYKSTSSCQFLDFLDKVKKFLESGLYRKNLVEKCGDVDSNILKCCGEFCDKSIEDVLRNNGYRLKECLCRIKINKKTKDLIDSILKNVKFSDFFNMMIKVQERGGMVRFQFDLINSVLRINQ